MKKEYFVNKESVEKLYKLAYDYCARKDLEGLKQTFENPELPVDHEQNGWTLLMLASYFDFYMAVDFLLKQGACLNRINESGSTALLGAISNNSYSCVLKLVKAGADVNLGDNKGFTPLMSACYNGNQEIVELLLDKPIEVMKTDVEGKTALDYAATNENFAVLNIIERNVIDKRIPLNSNKVRVVSKI